jgi:hypothetical protein
MSGIEISETAEDRYDTFTGPWATRETERCNRPSSTPTAYTGSRIQISARTLSILTEDGEVFLTPG